MLYLLYWNCKIRRVVDGHFDIKTANVLLNVNKNKIDLDIDSDIQ